MRIIWTGSSLQWASLSLNWRGETAEFDMRDYVMAGLTIHVGGRKHTTLKRLPAGRRFFRIPREVLRMKWEEKFNCSRKAGSMTGP